MNYPKSISLHISCLFVLVSFYGFGQYGSIEGKVLDQFGEPQFFAIIQLNGENKTRVDIDGMFRLDSVTVVQHTLSVRSSFYPNDTIILPIQIEDGKKLKLDLEYPVCEYAHNKKKCPVCNKKKHVIPIVYGLPSQGLIDLADEGEVVLGGCVISGCDPSWFCTKDEVRF